MECSQWSALDPVLGLGRNEDPLWILADSPSGLRCYHKCYRRSGI